MRRAWLVAFAAVVLGGAQMAACDTSRADVAATLDAGAAATCPVAAPTEESTYKPPRDASAACAPGIGAYATRFFALTPPPTYEDLERAIGADPTLGGAACAACVFSKEEDDRWGPIVYAAGGSGAAILDWGACFARAEGGTEACGEAVQRSRACVDAVCSTDDCVTESAARSCSQRALGEAEGCGRYPVDGTCGELLEPLSRSCSSLASLLNVMCASTRATGDAGADASADGGK